jgi:hypothetical protein
MSIDRVVRANDFLTTGEVKPVILEGYRQALVSMGELDLSKSSLGLKTDRDLQAYGDVVLNYLIAKGIPAEFNVGQTLRSSESTLYFYLTDNPKPGSNGHNHGRHENA